MKAGREPEFIYKGREKALLCKAMRVLKRLNASKRSFGLYLFYSIYSILFIVFVGKLSGHDEMNGLNNRVYILLKLFH